MDRATAQRHLANVERHIAEGRASVLRQQVVIGRFESAGSRRSETARIARAFLHQMERRLEMHIANREPMLQGQIALSDLSSRCIGPVRPVGRGSIWRRGERFSTKFHNLAL